MNSIVAIIPARSGSKGVPNKNIRLLGGHSVLNWSIKACKLSKLITRIIVSTDSLEYARIAHGLGAEVPFIRPADISGDNSSDYEFIDHALSILGETGDLPDYLVHVRPTTPFRNPLIIDDAVRLFLESPKATSLRSVHPMSETAYKALEISEDGSLMRIMSTSTDLDAVNDARQAFPSTYSANGYVDVLSVDYIIKNKKIHGNRVIPHITPRVTEIDAEDDFLLLEYELIKNPEIGDLLFKAY